MTNRGDHLTELTIDDSPIIDDDEEAAPAAPEPDTDPAAEIAVVAEEPEPEPDPTPAPARAIGLFKPLERAPVVGDPGRQGEVVASLGPHTVGVSDTELDFASVDPFEVRACSTRGQSHRYAGTPRQDAFAMAADDNWLVVAVADGVSQGTHSQVAAEVAARAACKLALEHASGELDWIGLSGRVSKRIIDEAVYRGIVDALPDAPDLAAYVQPVRKAMSTTAVVVLLSRLPTAAGTFAGELAVLAGDSGAYQLAGGTLSLLGGGKSDDGSPITSGAVSPLPGAVDPKLLAFELAPTEAVVLVTDGLGDPLGAGQGEVGRQLGVRWTHPPPIDSFFLDVNFLRRSFDDDRTAVGIWVLPPA